MGLLEPIPAAFEQEEGCTQFMAGWTHTGAQAITLTHSGTSGQFEVATPPAARVWMWEEAGEPGENPHEHGENMQSPRRRAP